MPEILEASPIALMSDAKCHGDHGLVRLLVRGVLLGLPFALFLVFFEFRFHHLTPSLYGVKKERLEKNAATIEVLILGASHPYAGIDPSILGRPAFNLAVVSQSLYYDAGLVRKYCEHLPALKTVILSVSYLSLQDELDQSSEPWRSYYYHYFYSLPHRDWHKDFSARNYSAYFLCNERVRARVLFGTCDNAAYDYDDWGGFTWGFRTNWPPAVLPPSGRTPEFLKAKAEESLKRHHADMKSGNVASNVERLETVISELKSRGVQAVLVTLPTSRFYRDGMKPEAYGLMQETVASLARDHDLTYKNYTFDPRFTDEDFSDGDHLSCVGQRKFSLILRDEVLGGAGIERNEKAIEGH